MKVLLVGPAVAAAVVGLLSFGAVGGAAAPAAAAAGRRRRALRWPSARAATASTARGVEDRGPDAARRGRGGRRLRAAHRPDADGRSRNMQAKRGPVRYTEDRDRRPRRPTSARSATARRSPTSTRPPATSPSGRRLYQLNCAACHVASGSGAAIGGGRDAPDLMESTPTEIGEAIRIGPGAMPVFGTFSDAGHRRRRRLHPRPAGEQHDGAGRLRRRRSGRRGPRRVAARAAAADRPDPLDRHAPRGPRRAASSRDDRGAPMRDASADGDRATATGRPTCGPTGRPSSRSSSPSPAASPRRSATAPTTPATCSGSGLAAALVRDRVRARLLGQVPRLRRARRAAARAARDRRRRAKAELHEELRDDRRACSVGASCSLGLLGGVVRQHGRRLRRPDRVARSEAARRARPDVVARRARGW